MDCTDTNYDSQFMSFYHIVFISILFFSIFIQPTHNQNHNRDTNPSNNPLFATSPNILSSLSKNYQTKTERRSSPNSSRRSCSTPTCARL